MSTRLALRFTSRISSRAPRRPTAELACAALAAAALGGCSAGPPAFDVRQASEIGLVANAPDIVGRDGGDSSLLWGRSVWVYGDTVLTVNDASGTNWHSNSASSTDDLDASDGIGGFTEAHEAGSGAVAYYVPETEDEAAFNLAHRGESCAEPPCNARWAIWPGAPLYDAARDRGILFYGLVYIGDDELPGGQSIAIVDGPDAQPRRPVFRPGDAHPTLLFPEGELPFGAAALVDGDDLVAFACTKDFVSYPCKMARVPLANVEDLSAWRYWDGDGYSDDPDDAETLFDGWVSMSIFHDDHLGQWIAVYSSLFSNDVVARTAPELTGPWSDEGLLFTADRKGSDDWTYDAMVHTEYTEDGGRVLYATHTRPNGNGWFGSETALWRVELE